MDNCLETKQLIKLNERFLYIAETVNAFRNEVKALKIFLKLIDTEIKAIKKCRQPIDSEKIKVILWRFLDLRNALKFLIRSKDAQEINKTCSDIKNMITVTERQLTELKAETAAGSISATSQKIVNVIGDTAQKIGDAVHGKIGGLKKMLSGEEDSKSE